MTDPIADMITRIRNASLLRFESVRIPSSKLKKEIARILKEEGYIQDLREDEEGKFKVLVLHLKYHDRKSVIRVIQKVSKPGRRRYVSNDQVFDVANGYGTLIVSTSKGVMTGYQARKTGVGGEPLIQVW